MNEYHQAQVNRDYKNREVYKGNLSFDLDNADFVEELVKIGLQEVEIEKFRLILNQLSIREGKTLNLFLSKKELAEYSEETDFMQVLALFIRKILQDMLNYEKSIDDEFNFCKPYYIGKPAEQTDIALKQSTGASKSIEYRMSLCYIKCSSRYFLILNKIS